MGANVMIGLCRVLAVVQRSLARPYIARPLSSNSLLPHDVELHGFVWRLKWRLWRIVLLVGALNWLYLFPQCADELW